MSIEAVQSRIRAIQVLIGEQDRSNEEFGEALKAAEGVKQSMAPADMQPFIQEASEKTGVPADLITAVIRTESGFNPGAISPVGAQGAMQLTPSTARALGVQNPFDPRENILAGSEYLREQLARFGSREKAVAAYNAGPGAVQRYGGVPPFPETQDYVRKVLGQAPGGTARRE
jgi:soluble lytic murein transglycosylase-like protein